MRLQKNACSKEWKFKLQSPILSHVGLTFPKVGIWFCVLPLVIQGQIESFPNEPFQTAPENP